jgi:hypothetical protein
VAAVNDLQVPTERPQFFGDGRASEKIVAFLEQ